MTISLSNTNLDSSVLRAWKIIYRIFKIKYEKFYGNKTLTIHQSTVKQIKNLKYAYIWISFVVDILDIVRNLTKISSPHCSL